MCGIKKGKMRSIKRFGEFFKTIGKRSVKSKKIFRKLVSNNDTLKTISRDLGKQLLKKKTLSYAVGATAIGATADYVVKYIKKNSGCFLYDKNNKRICKVNPLSCCSKNKISEPLTFCNQNHPKLFVHDKMFNISSACNSYNESTDDICCKYCDCAFHHCENDQKMKCDSPTIGEALSHLASNVGSEIFNTTLTIFPFLKGMGIVFLFVIFLFVMLNIFF